MQLDKMKLLVATVFQDPAIERLYEAGDKMSSHQTKHDLAHAIQVRDLAVKLAAAVSGAGSQLNLDNTTLEVVIPLAAYLHDIGRAIDVKNHAAAGAKWSRDYLKNLSLPGDHETLPKALVNRICKIIACHRSSLVLNREFNDPAWAIVVIADKCVGDEERVRPVRAAILNLLATFRLAWIPLRKGGIHDRVTFAIKNVDLTVDTSTVLLKLTIDRRVCAPKHILGTYGERFQACVKAARYLGFEFRMEFNGQRYTICRLKKTWVTVPTLPSS